MQIASDLHLEFYKNPLDVKLKISSPYLALLGDICVCGTSDIHNVEVFFNYYAPKYELIFWLPGNHEFYSGKRGVNQSIDQIIERCKKLCKQYKNVIFLNNKHYDIEINKTKYRIIGTTLWTDIPQEKEEYVLSHLNDYNHIYMNGERHIGIISIEGNVRLAPAYINALHTKATRYINRQIKDSVLPLIILTHHKPFINNEPDVKLDSTGYESDQVSKLTTANKRKIKVWCYGHTHRHFNSTVLYLIPRVIQDNKRNLKII
jgi:predicted MPP superfamily phosphohydrolase